MPKQTPCDTHEIEPIKNDKCDELDDTRFHQQELYDEWEKLAEEQESFDSEGE